MRVQGGTALRHRVQHYVLRLLTIVALVSSFAAVATPASAQVLPAGEAGVAYSQSLVTVAGAPYEATDPAELPAGLDVDLVTGELSGTPDEVGTFTFEVSSGGGSLFNTYSLTIAAPTIALDSTSMPPAMVGRAYNAVRTASGGNGPYYYCVCDITITPGPSGPVHVFSDVGLAHDPNSGAFSGIPTSVANVQFSMEAWDTGTSGPDAPYASPQQNYTIQIAPALGFVVSTLPNGVVSTPYSGQIGSATGGTPPYTYTLTDSTLPANLVMNSAGAITGAAASTGTFQFYVFAEDSNGFGLATGPFSITITDPPPLSLPAATLAGGYVGSPYAETQIAATGGATPYFYAQTAGALPPGLGIDSGTAAITGTPSGSGTFNFSVTVTDDASATATQSYTISIGDAVALPAAALGSGIVGAPYSDTQIAATGGATPYAYDVTAGGLPPGLSLDSGTAEISGTPTGNGTFNFSVTVTDDTAATATQNYTISIGDAVALPAASLASGIVGSPYTDTQIAATGGAMPYAYDVTAGGLPPGLDLDSSTAAITGTPTASGAYNFSVTVTDDTAATATQSYTIDIGDAVSLPAANLASGIVGSPYTDTQIAATGGAAPYAYDLTAGGLPPGLDLDSGTAAITGTPTGSGIFNFTVTVTDGTAATATQNYTISIGDELELLAAALSDGVLGSAYSSSGIVAAGGLPPYTFAVTGGLLPPGLALDPTTAEISGTPTASGQFDFTVEVTDTASDTASQSYAIVVADGLTLPPTALSAGLVGVAYAQTLNGAEGGFSPYAYSVTAGGLPPGLALDTASLVIDGNPSQAGSFSFTLEAIDDSGATASQSYTIEIGDALSLPLTALPNGTVGQAYGATLDPASGGTPPYSYSIAAGSSLPPGLSLDASSGVIGGTPTAPGSTTFTVVATDALGRTAEQVQTITIEPATITISPASLPDGEVMRFYQQAFTATGGTGPYSFSSNNLDFQFTLSESGELRGISTQPGTILFTVTATDSLGSSTSSEYSLTIAPEIEVNPPQLPPGMVGQPYSQAFSATGGVAPYYFEAIIPHLPDGLSLSGAGVLSGTPTEPGLYGPTIRVTDANGRISYAARSLFIEGAITIEPGSLPNGFTGRPYFQQLSASGGAEPYSFSVGGGYLPVGLSLSAAGELTGTPTGESSSMFTVEATDANGLMGRRDYWLNIGPATLEISPPYLPDGEAGVPYAQTLVGSGGTAPYRFSVDYTQLPAGISLSSEGLLAGTAIANGTFTFTVFVEDATNFYSGHRIYTLVISAPTITIEPPALPEAREGVPYHQQFSASGSVGPYSFAVSGGTLPAGLTLEPDGVLSGTPATGGSFSFTVTATDSLGFTGERTFTLEVAALPDPRDPELLGVIESQHRAVNAFADDQQSNFAKRLEELHAQGPAGNSIGIVIADDNGASAYFPQPRPRPGEDALDMALALDPVDTPSDLGFWTAGRITVGIKDGTADVLEFSTGGISFGADYRLSDMLTLGIGGGFGGDRTVIGTNGSEAEAAAHYLAIYGTFRPAADFFIDGVLGAGLIELSSRRFVSATGELALGDRVGQQVFGSLATGYDYREGDFSLGAYGRVQGAFASLGAFTESGGGPLGALSYSDQQVWSLTGVLGLRADYSFHLEGGTLTPAVRVEYRGGTEGTSDANVSYAGLLDGPLYGLAGGSGAQNALTLGLETDFAFEDGPTISLGYRTRIGASGERSHSLTFYLGGQL